MPTSISVQTKNSRSRQVATWGDDKEFELFSPAKQKLTEVQDIDAARALIAKAEEIITAQHKRIADLENLALTDELTGLMNRRGLMQELKRELAAARRDETANGILILCDLDGFKDINDKFGHATGDAYLKAVADFFQKEVRETDVVARLGGDEFAVLLTRIEPATALLRACAIESAFNSRTMSWQGETFGLRGSFGFTVYNGHDNMETLMASADLKLYAHKARRRG